MTENISETIQKELKREKYNNLRMIEINTYYSKLYQAYLQVIKIIIFILVCIILLVVLEKKNILFFVPSVVYRLMGIGVLVVGGYYLFSKINDISNRDNMDFDKYTWIFNRANQDIDTNKQDNLDKNDENKNKCSNLSLKEQALHNLNGKGFSNNCVGENCCGDNMSYDDKTNKCVSLSGFENRDLLTSSCTPFDGNGEYSGYDNNNPKYSSVY